MPGGVVALSTPVVCVAEKSRTQLARAITVTSSGNFSRSSWLPLR